MIKLDFELIKIDSINRECFMFSLFFYDTNRYIEWL